MKWIHPLALDLSLSARGVPPTQQPPDVHAADEQPENNQRHNHRLAPPEIPPPREANPPNDPEQRSRQSGQEHDSGR